ncbi:Aldehyde/histidinol dehydrogenase [Hypoxylon argillaceum]|nr:Aldehyde/histidinol dehydrogenase [Hypoxylon argillaceum]
MAACASTLKRVTLQLGGNDAAIICDDVDIKSVAKDIYTLTFTSPGQMCMGIKRIYYEKLERLYSQSGKKGWKTNYGGGPYPDDKPHRKMRPTILDNPPDDSSVVANEKLGPIVPVLKWTEEDDVIRRVNASRLGLGTSVWSLDPRHAIVPLGGHRESNPGTDLGEVGLQGWYNSRVIWVKALWCD